MYTDNHTYIILHGQNMINMLYDIWVLVIHLAMGILGRTGTAFFRSPQAALEWIGRRMLPVKHVHGYPEIESVAECCVFLELECSAWLTHDWPIQTKSYPFSSMQEYLHRQACSATSLIRHIWSDRIQPLIAPNQFNCLGHASRAWMLGKWKLKRGSSCHKIDRLLQWQTSGCQVHMSCSDGCQSHW